MVMSVVSVLFIKGIVYSNIALIILCLVSSSSYNIALDNNLLISIPCLFMLLYSTIIACMAELYENNVKFNIFIDKLNGAILHKTIKTSLLILHCTSLYTLLVSYFSIKDSTVTIPIMFYCVVHLKCMMDYFSNTNSDRYSLLY